MPKGEVIKHVAAGLFFIVGLLLIFGVVFVIGVEKGITQPKFEVDVLFKQVGGLTQGAPIRLSGVDVGVVQRVGFIPEPVRGRWVKVTLNIFENYREQMQKSTSIAIRTEGVLGEKLIEVSADPLGKPLDLSQPVIGAEPLDVYDLAEVLNDTALSLQQTTEVINQMTVDLKLITHKTKRTINRVEEKLIDGKLFSVF